MMLWKRYDRAVRYRTDRYQLHNRRVQPHYDRPPFAVCTVIIKGCTEIVDISLVQPKNRLWLSQPTCRSVM
ncbi:hypothetical protein SCLCIDRAFT_1206889 [Scleroderma citrinum Foug A]|uniref:Uncharacterized protein n=1 Tax=Scleroderma citrinum Foug A TaxID=1036808 RepID=A0A0C3B0E9_9AGAM|nr:hypothetical protein SCLCIDRAFT_1206889 [Scleroderma citrinum Foug A]